MPDENIVFKNIEKLGERYVEEILLEDCNKATLESDWWKALKFFFGRSFMRGRRDELSNAYKYFAFEILEKYFSIGSENLDKSYEKVKENEKLFDIEPIKEFRNRIKKGDTKGSIIKHDDFEREVASRNPLVKILITPKEVQVRWKGETNPKTVHLGNEEDIMMVLDVLKFISDEKRKNIYKHLKETIRNTGAKEAYEELIKIRSIAEKLATFVIRDIILLNPEIKITNNKDYKYAFPVDTWVEQVAEKLRYRGEKKDIVQFFIGRCDNLKISPLKFAAGLWYLGFNSLDLAFEYLNKLEIDA